MPHMTPTRGKRRLWLALLLLPMLAACGRGKGTTDQDLIVTNSGDIATNAQVANQAEADGNDQPNNLAGVPAKGSAHP